MHNVIFFSPFVFGGVAEDKIRNIEGSIGYIRDMTVSGVFYVKATANNWAITNTNAHSQVSMDASRSIPTGNENSPRTISIQYWRRVS